MRIYKVWFGILFVISIAIVFMVVTSSPDQKEAQSVEVKNTVRKEGKAVLSNQPSMVEATKLEDFIDKEPILSGAMVGISIRSTDGSLLYEKLGNTRFSPASNMKLLTGAVALEVLGKDYTFSTEIRTNGRIDNGTLQGDLYLKGKGDPTLLLDDFENIVMKIKEQGIEKIEGNIIGDDTWYDDVRLSRDLTWTDEHWYYGAQVSALTASPNKDYDSGSVIVEVNPGQNVGDSPIVTVSPDNNYIDIDNTAETVATGEEDLTFGRVHGDNTITIEGTIPVGDPSVTEWMAVWEPTGYALELFLQSLEKEGIEWTGSVKTGQSDDSSDLLYTHQSMPLSELLIPFMKLSNNGHAEVLVKEMGKVVHGEGSWEKGIEVMEATLQKLGLNPEKLIIRDGSGISYINMVPPNELTKLLSVIQDKEWFDTFFVSLPVAGNPERLIGGTLRYRLGDVSVQAKTGTIAGVSTLSGYIDTQSGEQIIFSVLLNQLLDEDYGPQVIDKMVELIWEEF